MTSRRSRQRSLGVFVAIMAIGATVVLMTTGVSEAARRLLPSRLTASSQAATIVAASSRLLGGGWLLASTGRVTAFGNAPFEGDFDLAHGPAFVGIASTPDGVGYWLADADGGVFPFGDAGFHGSLRARSSEGAIVGIGASPDGHGYWLVSNKGKVSAFGDAGYYGSLRPGQQESIVGIGVSPDGHGYWLVSNKGKVFPFGDASFHHSLDNRDLRGTIIGMATTLDGRGYWLASTNGGVFAFGDARFYGSATRGRYPPIVAITRGTNGYYLVNRDAGWASFSEPTSAPVPHVIGNALVQASGMPLRLLGVDVSGTEDACVERAGISWGPLDTQEAKAIASWHANVVRVPLNEDCWLGTDGAPEGYSAAAYRNEVVNWVRAINDAGMVAILDLHWAAPGHQMATQQWPMPDADHSITFWSQVAETFLGDPSVIFDLFNEPYLGGKAPTASDWSCWLNGCTAYFQDVSYQVAGMQQLLDAVRAVGATQPVMVGGLNWAGDPCGLSDAGHDSAVCAWLTYTAGSIRTTS